MFIAPIVCNHKFMDKSIQIHTGAVFICKGSVYWEILTQLHDVLKNIFRIEYTHLTYIDNNNNNNKYIFRVKHIQSDSLNTHSVLPCGPG